MLLLSLTQHCYYLGYVSPFCSSSSSCPSLVYVCVTHLFSPISLIIHSLEASLQSHHSLQLYSHISGTLRVPKMPVMNVWVPKRRGLIICVMYISASPSRLARFDKPIGTYLLLWPGYWSIAMAASQGCLPDLQVKVCCNR